MQTGTLSQQNRHNQWLRCVIVLIATSIVLASCTSSTSDQTDEEAVSHQVTFVASPDGGIGPTRAIIRMDEEFAVLDGNTGCHRILGSFTLNDETGAASFTVPGVSTNSCDAAQEEVEMLILNALAQVTSFRRLGADFQFQDSTQQVVLRLEQIS